MLGTQVEMLFFVLAKAYRPFRWADMASACSTCYLILKKRIKKKQKFENSKIRV